MSPARDSAQIGSGRARTEDEPFDFDGSYLHLTGAFCNPKPVQRPHPPILIGGRSTAALRVVAEHADLWNFPGHDLDDGVRRGSLLDRFCAEIGRDPASITRSIVLPVSYDHPGSTRDAIAEASGAGFRHIILSLPAPYPESATCDDDPAQTNPQSPPRSSQTPATPTATSTTPTKHHTAPTPAPP